MRPNQIMFQKLRKIKEQIRANEHKEITETKAKFQNLKDILDQRALTRLETSERIELRTHLRR